MSSAAPSRFILGTRVDATSYPEATRDVLAWAAARESRYICVATVSQVMEGIDHVEVEAAMNGADLVTPDGMPLVWGLRMLGIGSATRVYGPDLTPSILCAAARDRVPVGFYGSTPEVLSALLEKIRERYPDLAIAYSFSPPFRPLTPSEDRSVVQDIVGSGCRILFIGMSNPKQELWMAAHQGCIPAVMLGVGAAFDFLAGTKRQAPRLLMSCGMEWFFRLCTEPRRLWKRYLKHNPRFVVLFLLQLLGCRRTAVQI